LPRPNFSFPATVSPSMQAMNICNILWTAFWAVWLLWAIGTKRAQRRESLAWQFTYGALLLAGFLLMFANLRGVRWLHTRVLPTAAWLQVAGIAITVAGFALAFWARMHLGRNWSSAVMAKVGHELIRSGPYRWVRHPIYSGLLLALLGTALVRGQVRGLCSLFLVYLGFKIKSLLEERMMTSTFGAEYTSYASATGAILPRMRKKQLASSQKGSI
jgi:protein-S-isoprenylcysteine O-methyltransferase Ste14